MLAGLLPVPPVLPLVLPLLFPLLASLGGLVPSSLVHLRLLALLWAYALVDPSGNPLAGWAYPSAIFSFFLMHGPSRLEALRTV